MSRCIGSYKQSPTKLWQLSSLPEQRDNLNCLPLPLHRELDFYYFPEMINFRRTLCQRRSSESEMCIKWRREQFGIVKNSWKDHWGCYQENFSPNWNKYVELKIYHISMSKRSLGTAVSFVCLWFTVKNFVEYLQSSLLHCRFVPLADIEQKNCWSHFNSKCQGNC